MSLERRFVFDTNVLVSAFLFKKGIPRAALDLAMSIGQILRSEETLDELWDVLVRPKFDRFLPLSDRIMLLRAYEHICHPIVVTSNMVICHDSKDDKFLNLAQDANAECITTGDKDLLVLADSFTFAIFTPAQFLEKNQ